MRNDCSAVNSRVAKSGMKSANLSNDNSFEPL
jgi:hypothetical protein